MARGRDEATTSALHPTQIGLAGALRDLTHDIEEFGPSEVTTAFLSPAAAQQALVSPVYNFISTVECIQSDYVGEATNSQITIDDARDAADERGAVSLARQINLKALIKETPQVTAFFQQKLTHAYEEVIAVLRTVPIEGNHEKILFNEVMK